MRTILALLLLAGCAGDPPPCKLDGSYRVSATERHGDCGPMPDQVDSTNTSDIPGCSQHAENPPTDVECGITYARTCRNSDGSTVILGVSIQREGDDETWTGAADVTLSDAAGRQLCHSLYDLTFTKL